MATMAEFSMINKENITEKERLFKKVMNFNTIVTLVVVVIFLVAFPPLVKNNLSESLSP